ncbi:hypothetical protein DVA86_20405 [Streptomyces armeniacus]|uniref:Uncharacterized protein n=1 Tax=Streptomyces armeniacus TaxID=83291 RepID=A0A345XSP2_9ACTN|nr:hypothetical protein [Streptomyces armeniacus]AXK34658.1 hypothetical protein DVA86_20405 [Streptomyces armeniacus]
MTDTDAVVGEYLYREAPPEWEDAVRHAAALLSSHWPKTPSRGVADAVGTVALLLYVLARSAGTTPAEVPAERLVDELDGPADIEGEPYALREALHQGLVEQGHTERTHPLRQLLARLSQREPLPQPDIPLDLTGGLTRWPSTLSDTARWTHAVLDGARQPGTV